MGKRHTTFGKRAHLESRNNVGDVVTNEAEADVLCVLLNHSSERRLLREGVEGDRGG